MKFTTGYAVDIELREKAGGDLQIVLPRDGPCLESHPVAVQLPEFADGLADLMYVVEQYPDHGFIIDFDEAKRIGVRVKEPTLEQAAQLDKILLHITKMNAFGRVVEG